MIEGVTLRELVASDADRLAELEAQLFAGDGPWSEPALRAEISHPATVYIGAERDGTVIGYAGLALLGPAYDIECEVHTIGVAPGEQGNGVGKLLLDELLATADRLAAPVFLEVRTDNAAAIGLYEARGFARIGLRKNYYRPSGADALVMRREGRGQA
ncbi:ribosomal protein S18-alanine N-acetyltransferase [Corynebacterium uterequi]|uniref:Ribosomal-protein-alanine acetyltransferase n=1 Tax=Corynebacterium uterequi TaxID=1072256 RepID=A0A0G3HH07_9CORY|nr:ribosomal protein S18-alanine N-acetyltransferase [Corynebacterium uterequi]AKK10437.1 ribosomal-protein-alanine acetyltransferase [Corynebacterium uterequi]